MFPTPAARDWRSGKASDKTRAKNARPLSEVAAPTGLLNPDWEEWLMGLPVGWTDVGASPGRTVPVDYWAEEPGGVPRVTTRKTNRVARLKAIGNGQVPQVTEWIGRRIMKLLDT